MDGHVVWSGASHLALFDWGDEEMEKEKRLIKSHIQIMWHTQFTLLTSSHGYRSIDNADCREASRLRWILITGQFWLCLFKQIAYRATTLVVTWNFFMWNYLLAITVRSLYYTKGPFWPNLLLRICFIKQIIMKKNTNILFFINNLKMSLKCKLLCFKNRFNCA